MAEIRVNELTSESDLGFCTLRQNRDCEGVCAPSESVRADSQRPLREALGALQVAATEGVPWAG